MFYLKSSLIYFYCLACCTLFLFSCNKKEKTTSLYNIDSLITAQVKYLNGNRAKLQKSASISSKTDDSTYVPADTTTWNAELEIFRSLQAINKPVNRDLYLVDDGLFDPASNLTVKAFSALKDDLPVKYVRVFYQESISRPRKIEGLYDDRNSLYKSGRILSMEFQQINNKSVLTSYSIQGGQKMILADTIGFTIKGKITVD